LYSTKSNIVYKHDTYHGRKRILKTTCATKQKQKQKQYKEYRLALTRLILLQGDTSATSSAL